MNVYYAVAAALVCAFMGGFLAQYLISKGQKALLEDHIQQLLALLPSLKRDAKGRFCK